MAAPTFLSIFSEVRLVQSGDGHSDEPEFIGSGHCTVEIADGWMGDRLEVITERGRTLLPVGLAKALFGEAVIGRVIERVGGKEP